MSPSLWGKSEVLLVFYSILDSFTCTCGTCAFLVEKRRFEIFPVFQPVLTLLLAFHPPFLELVRSMSDSVLCLRSLAHFQISVEDSVFCLKHGTMLAALLQWSVCVCIRTLSRWFCRFLRLDKEGNLRQTCPMVLFLLRLIKGPQ